VTKGKITKWLDDRGFGFVTSEAHPSGIFLHCSSVWSEPGEALSVGTEVEYDTDTDKHGRPRAINVRLVRPEPDECAPYVQRPGERRQYDTRHLTAEHPPIAAIERDRARGRHARRDSGAAERERIWSNGADGF
jgi:cold shock CspA family protein